MLVDPNDSEMSIENQCGLLGIARSSYYYSPISETAENLQLMMRIHEIHYDHPAYGYRKIHACLRREGHRINIKRVERLWNILGLRSILPKEDLSKPNLAHKKYPYLLNGMKITRPNQVFSMDITYIVMSKGFLYLASVMDWYSRFVLSWEISNTMNTNFCIIALEAALKIALPEYFNVDQGSQFTSELFINELKKLPIKISMDGVGRASDNVYKEREWWTTKHESLYLHRFETVKELYLAVKQHYHRPHQGLLYAVPYEIYHGLPPKYSKGIYKGFEVKKAKAVRRKKTCFF